MAYNLIGGGSDLNGVVTTMNRNISELKDQDIRKIYKDEQGNRVVVIDKDGLRTTKPGSGIDVMTATNNEFTFNSAQNTFKIIGEGTMSIYAEANETRTFTQAHGQSFVPIVWFFLNTGLGFRPLPSTVQMNRDDAAGFVKLITYIDGYADATNINVRFLNADATRAPLGTGKYSVKYYILQETAE